MLDRAAHPRHIGLSCLLSCLGLLAAGAPPARGQTGLLRGIVADSAGAPIEAADVAIVEVHELARTDDHGRFTLSKVPRSNVEVSVRRLGYRPTIVHVDMTAAETDSIHVTLAAVPELLATTNVSTPEILKRQGIEEFYRNRARGIGKYVTRAEILARGARTPTDMLRNLSGVEVVRLRDGRTGIRLASAARVRRDCMPTLWLDGQRAHNMEVDEVPINDIEGIELYRGPSTTPARYAQGAVDACGTIVIWTRAPGS
jgi:hypothetical protein